MLFRSKAMPDPTKFDIEHLGNDLFAVYLTSENPIYLQIASYNYTNQIKTGINFRILGTDKLKAVSNEGNVFNNGSYTFQPNLINLSFYETMNGAETIITSINLSEKFETTIDYSNLSPRGTIANIKTMVSGDNSNSITLSRDANGRVITIATNEGYNSTYQYNSAGKIISETDFVGATKIGRAHV